MIECLNEGFIDATCRCKCSDGISGDFCEIINEKESKFKSNLKFYSQNYLLNFKSIKL